MRLTRLQKHLLLRLIPPLYPILATLRSGLAYGWVNRTQLLPFPKSLGDWVWESIVVLLVWNVSITLAQVLEKYTKHTSKIGSDVPHPKYSKEINIKYYIVIFLILLLIPSTLLWSGDLMLNQFNWHVYIDLYKSLFTGYSKYMVKAKGDQSELLGPILGARLIWLHFQIPYKLSRKQID